MRAHDLGAALAASLLIVACGSSSNGARGSATDAGCDGACGDDAGAADTGSTPGEDASVEDSGDDANDGGGGGPPLLNDGALTDRGQPPCTVTMTGAQVRSFDCVVTATYFASSMKTSFTLTVPMPEPLEQVSVSLENIGPLMSGTWGSNMTGASGNVTVRGVSGGAMIPTWGAQASAGAAVGSYTLEVMFKGGMASMGGGEAVGASGMLSASLAPVASTGAMGTIVLNATF
jgi:hypothetical protein